MIYCDELHFDFNKDKQDAVPKVIGHGNVLMKAKDYTCENYKIQKDKRGNLDVSGCPFSISKHPYSDITDIIRK